MSTKKTKSTTKTITSTEVNDETLPSWNAIETNLAVNTDSAELENQSFSITENTLLIKSEPETKTTISRQEYKLVTVRSDSTSFQSQVTDLLNDGWKLIGGASTAMYMYGYSASPIFTQAVCKEFSE